MSAALRLVASALFATFTLVGWISTAHAEPPVSKAGGSATFAVIVGNNRSVDEGVTPLRYADDDAARYQDLFRRLGARTYLLTRLDDNTRALHPQAAAEAGEPRRATFDRVMTDLARDVSQAASRGVATVVYFVYAGHGDVKNGQGYVTLEDARLTGPELLHAFSKVPATRIHVVVDACASYFLAVGRGPGGERRPLGEVRAASLGDDPRIGMLLSTSSARESHEWEGFEGGVFSHEVRSGLYGAADADRDGEITYREMAAFVARANAAIPSEKYRPDVFARAPQGTSTLADIREGLRRRVVIDGSHAGHYVLEDGRGVRIADAHNASGLEMSLIAPVSPAPVYLRRIDDEHEYALPREGEVLALADLPVAERTTLARGAAHDSFGLVFSLPFSQADVSSYTPALSVPPSPSEDSTRRADSKVGWRRPLAYGALGLSVVGVGAGVTTLVMAHGESNGSSSAESQKSAIERNDRIATLNTASAISFAAGGVFAAASAFLFLWPGAPARASAPAASLVSVSPESNGFRAMVRGTF
ncbi:hypothetical protein AKJ09_01582 [Labilithrix luteola]|uniref:Peptidase C14 caspase domain-containing protein n=1 Tax=Labilithrix luteola TaxID=1391654 RepID=A0A0K1PN12_9BACT|nr:caspase family protein [Labilithrix luteola]AKU94918.1 hypothetical protein AKJ09_01582 [Labilithrix luteola]